MQWWTPLLQRYWRKFKYWLPVLLDELHPRSGLSPPVHNHLAAWKVLKHRWGTTPKMTRSLVTRFRITILGRYRCHGT
jgi:hypothetical protein